MLSFGLRAAFKRESFSEAVLTKMSKYFILFSDFMIRKIKFTQVNLHIRGLMSS